MKEFDPTRTPPVEEERSRLDPIGDTQELFQLYEARVLNHYERLLSGDISASEDIMQALEGMRLAAKLLPEDDPRSYEAWKKKNCTPAQQ